MERQTVTVREVVELRLMQGVPVTYLPAMLSRCGTCRPTQVFCEHSLFGQGVADGVIPAGWGLDGGDDIAVKRLSNGDSWWMKSGIIHRDAGPATKFYTDTKELSVECWYENGIQHRADGPAAFVYDDEDKTITHCSYSHGRMHSYLGPAHVVFSMKEDRFTRGDVVGQEYWLHGMPIDEAEFNKFVGLPPVEMSYKFVETYRDRISSDKAVKTHLFESLSRFGVSVESIDALKVGLSLS